MLSSPKKISSAKQAGHYFKQADYYTKGADHVDISSAWFGEGAKTLGLEGIIEHPAFEAMLAGVLPDGTVLDHANRVCGWDLTFSAPKSVSILALPGRDERLMEAHFNAVKAALSLAEKEFLVTRKREDGEVVIEKTGNLVAALFTHTTSRALDPNLHTHSVIMNMTQNDKQQWRSLESNPLFDNRILLGLAYQNSLARQCYELGYTPVRNDKTGQFELEEVPQTLIDEFSKRRKEIVDAAHAQGVPLNDAKRMEQLTLFTREAKKNVSGDQLFSDWESRLDQHEFQASDSVTHARDTAQIRSSQAKTYDPLNTIRLAIENLSFKDSVFTRQALIKESFRFGYTDLDTGKIGSHIDTLVANQALLKGYKDDIGQVKQIAYTTPASVDREKQILGLLHSGIGQLPTMATKTEVAEFIQRYNQSADKPLQAEQQATLEGIALNTDRFQGIQGLPGVGKSTLMLAFNQLANEKGYRLIGIAPTGTAAQELYRASGISTRTIDSLLEIDRHTDPDKNRQEPNTVYLTDESGMVSDRHMLALMRLTQLTDSRMNLIGDINQIAAIEAGKPFEQQQKSVLAYEVMRNVQRQQDLVLRSAVMHGIDHSISGAFSLMQTSTHHDTGVTDIEHEEKRHQAAVSHYHQLIDHKLQNGVSLFDAVRQSVKLITPLNVTKDSLNELVREVLHEKGGLDTQGQIEMLRLLPKNITPVERQQAICFTPFHHDEKDTRGDLIRFHADINAHGIKEGEYYGIKSINGTVVTMVNEARNHSVSLDMTLFTEDYLMTAFSASRKLVTIGEQLRWRDTYQATKLRNGQSLEVTAIDHESKQFTVKTDDGREITLNDNFAGAHSDHNYAVTTNSIQGGTIDKTILVYSSRSKRLHSRNNLIVALSRGVNGTHVYADNAEKVAKIADSNVIQKGSALEHIGQPGQAAKVNQPGYKQDVFEAYNGVNLAVNHLAGQFSSFSKYEIMRHAMRFSGQSAPVVDMAISKHQAKGLLIDVVKTKSHVSYFTTPDIVKQEKALQKCIKQSFSPPGVSEQRIEHHAVELALSDEAKYALYGVFRQPHQVILINGKNTTATTLLMHAVHDIAKETYQSVEFVAASNVEQHSERIGKDVLSIGQYLQGHSQASLVVLLDAHNSSTSNMRRFLAQSEQVKAKAVLQGIASLNQEFAHKHVFHFMTRRADTSSQLFDLSKDSATEADRMLEQSEKMISEETKRSLQREAQVINRESDRHDAIVEVFLKNPANQNVISASKEGAEAMTKKIREKLKAAVKITNHKTVNTLNSVFMSPQQKRIASEYQVGQILIFNRKGEKDGFSRQETYVIEHIDPQSNTLVLSYSEGSRKVNINDLKNNGFSVVTPVKLELGRGDQVRFDTGIFDQHIPAMARGTVHDISHAEQSMKVNLDTGRQVMLDLKLRAHQFISHGYAIGMNRAGQIPMNHHALVELDARFKSGANLQSFIKALSNAKKTVSLYADNYSSVHEYLSPSKDHSRSLDKLLDQEKQRAMADSINQNQSHNLAQLSERIQQQHQQNEREQQRDRER